MDSAGYTEKTLGACKDVIKWMIRVPENLKDSKAAVQKTYTTWQPLADGYQYVPLISTQFGIEQRWLLVFSDDAYKREIYTLKKQFAKHSAAELKAFTKLCKQDYDTEKKQPKPQMPLSTSVSICQSIY